MAETDWTQGNLISNGDFTGGSDGGLPHGWHPVCPNPALAPAFQRATRPDGVPELAAEGNGRRECFGYVRHHVFFSANRTYRLRAQLRFEGIEDLNRHVVHALFAQSPTAANDGIPTTFNDGIFTYRREGDTVVGEHTFAGPPKDTDAEVRLYFRFSPHGKVWWEHISLQESEPIEPRVVKVACSWGAGDLDHWSAWLDQAGRRGADIALLPEAFNGKPPSDPEPIDGAAGQLMASKARQWRMYVSGSFYEQRRDLVLNTAPLFDREGELLGTYSKNQLFDPEEDAGASPGVGFPVFEADFGKVGIIICYDSWFPEPTRLLAYKGAELVLFPNAGYFTGIMPARSADNGVWVAVSSVGGPADVWDPGGGRAGESEPNPTRHAATSVLGFEKDEVWQLVLATVDLSRRYSPHWWGGPMLSAPGGRRLRQTLIVPLEPEIVYEAQRWWEDGPLTGETSS